MALLGALGIVGSMTAVAGNIPQYIPSYRHLDSFPFLEQKTKVACDFKTHNIVYSPDDMVGVFAYHKGEGFPIGFELTFGGQKFTRFAISSWGALLFGTEEDGVTHCGMNNLFNGKSYSVLDFDQFDQFYVGMMDSDIHPDFMTVDGDILEPEINIATLGEEGNLITVVEFLHYSPNCVNNEPQGEATYYNLQIRLHQADNSVEVIFDEELQPWKSHPMMLGLRGFDVEDTLLLHALSVADDPEISTMKWFDMFNTDCNVIWKQATDENFTEWKVAYTFTPVTDKTAPTAAPVSLEATQEGADAVVSCKKAEGADATVLLMSKAPFTAADFPSDGVTFSATSKAGEFETTFGNATVLYYGDADDIKVTIPAIEQMCTYYFAAVSANGYPAFNTSNYATATLASSQAAPTAFSATASGAGSVRLEWTADYPVIIAATDICSYYADVWYEGVFGTPSADVNVGDEIPGGGVVIYVGEGNEFDWTDAFENGMIYFGAWTLNEGQVSKLNAFAHAVTLPELPYEPRLELYPSAIMYDEVEANTESGAYLGSYSRDYDNARAIRMRLVAGEPIEFYLPELDLSAGDAELTFEYALETDRGFESDGKVQIPLGYGPGHFDNGALSVNVKMNGNTTLVKEIKSYDGDMVSNGDNGYMQGSSTFVKETVPLADFAGKAKIGFRGLVDEFSILYLRNIRVDGTSTGVREFQAIPAGAAAVKGGKGFIAMTSATDALVSIYSIDGRRVAVVAAQAGEETTVALPAGLYIANGKKVIVK